MSRRKRPFTLSAVREVIVTTGIAAISSIAAVFLAKKLGFRRGKYGVKIERSHPIITSDDISLVADIYHPKRPRKTPTILVRIPYSKTFINTLFSTTVGRMWAARGYTVVIQGTRGRYESGGRYYPFQHERNDGIETLQWLAKQRWYNGRVGMWGGSYFGYTQWVLADQREPGLSALMLQICSSDFHGMFYRGGAFSLESALFWAVTSYGEQDIPASDAALQRGYEGWPLIEADTRAVQDIPFFKDWVSHPEKDPYWTKIDGERRTHSLQAPALLMAGWYDAFLPTQIEDFLRIRYEAKRSVAAATRLIIGPWAHARTVTLADGTTPKNYRLESLAPSIPWFDRHLKNLAPSPEVPTRGDDKEELFHFMAPIRIYVMGKKVWRDEQEWPLARTHYTNYYLHSGGAANSLNGDGQLLLTPPTSVQPNDLYFYDPHDPVPSAGGTMLGLRAGIERQNAIEQRGDVLVYTTPILEEDIELTGPITLVLYVSTTAPCTDFTGKLVDVHPDGSAYNVCDGILRRNYVSTSQQPSQIQIDLWPTSMVFFNGHRMRLEVSSSNYPRFDRNPNTGRKIATETEPIAATQKIYHSLDTPSHLILPVIPL